MALKARGFAHLNVRSYYSFLDGASSPSALIARAAESGMAALALTDRNGLHGAGEFIGAAQAAGIKPILGCSLTVAPLLKPARQPHYSLTLLADGNTGYENLCRLLTRAHLSNPRGEPVADLHMLEEHSSGIYVLAGGRHSEIGDRALSRNWQGARTVAEIILGIFGPKRFFLEAIRDLTPGSLNLSRNLFDLAEALKLGVVATNEVRHAGRDDFRTHDILACIRSLTGINEVHPWRPFNRERYLKNKEGIRRLFLDKPQAVENALMIAEECRPGLDLNKKRYPRFPLPEGEKAENVLRHLVYQGAVWRYGKITPAIQGRLEHELGIINRLGFAHYFLIVWDIARFARQEGILFAGRGSAADSAAAYCLGITEVDSIRRGLLFERFISPERAEMPDIDIDFDARHRDAVADYLTGKYGKDHVAAVCTYQTFRARSAVRDVGRALGIPLETVDRVAKSIPWHLPADAIQASLDDYPELKALGSETGKLRLLFDICAEIAGLPRHVGTHLGGLIVSDKPVSTICPLQKTAKGPVAVQCDKHGAETLGLLKIDLLSLRTLSAIRDSGAPERIRLDDPGTYGMIRRGDTIGVFQLESPAQRALQARLGADNIEDIIASIALIRPGPIKGNMVEPFIRRRQGLEEPEYLHPSLRPILSKTFGVVLFQEQVIDIAQTVAGFTAGEADRLRRVMSHARSQQAMDEIGEVFVEKATANGVDPDTAREIFRTIAGYASYGFCEAHAAAFAVTSYRTAYLTRHKPAEWFASILTHQPSGYYPRQTIITEARRRGIRVLAPHIQESVIPFRARGERVIEVGFCAIKDLGEKAALAILTARQDGPFHSLSDLRQRTHLEVDQIRALILAGALDPIEGNRRKLLWQLSTTPVTSRVRSQNRAGDAVQLTIPGIPGETTGTVWSQGMPDFPDFKLPERVYYEFCAMGFSLTAHPAAIWRDSLGIKGLTDTRRARRSPNGTRVRVAGLAIRPHRPPTRSGRTVAFLSLEDEHGLIDVTVFEYLYRGKGHLLFGTAPPLLLIEGKVRWQGAKPCIIAEDIEGIMAAGDGNISS